MIDGCSARINTYSHSSGTSGWSTLSTEILVGIVVPIVVVLVILGIVLFCCLKKCTTKKQQRVFCLFKHKWQ